MNKPYSESCDQNCDPILSVIQPLLSKAESVLEIGSGTGQHAVFFAKKMPHLQWQSSDCREHHEGINQWIDDAGLANVKRPLALNVSEDTWMSEQYDAVFSANTLHIMHHNNVQDLFENIASVLKKNGKLMVYGPFKYNGDYTSDSNMRFDVWLKNRDPNSGIKDIEWVNGLAREAGLTLQKDYVMPANNQILYWKKSS